MVESIGTIDMYVEAQSWICLKGDMEWQSKVASTWSG